MKKLTTLVTLSLFALNAHAIDITKIQVQLGQMNFQNNKGSGVLNNLVLETDSGLQQNVDSSAAAVASKIDLSLQGKTVKVNTGAMSIVMRNTNEMLTKIQTMQISKLNVSMGASQHQFSVGSAHINHESTGEIIAEALNVVCTYKNTGVLDFSQVVDQCLAKSSTHAERLEIPDMNSFFEVSLFGVPIEPENDVLQTVKELELEITKGDFEMSLKIKGIPLVRLKSHGNIKVDMTKRRATIRVDKVKLGFIGVTDIVMNQLKKKLPPENFRVEPPYIFATW
ncbi:MAG: hypothetical protein V4654_05500 [Bdellovibrionota bacterium]